MATELLSTCRLCPAFCGMRVELDGERIVGTRGDKEHPISRGYLCPKGRSAAEFHHHPDRLDHPGIDGVHAGWDATLDDLADRMGTIVSRDGPEAIGYYTASGGAYDSAGRSSIGAFFRKLGSSQRYSAVTVDCAPAVRANQIVTGHAEIVPEFHPDEEAPKLFLTIGSNPVVSHAQMGMILGDPVRWFRGYQEQGGQIWVVDPRRTETARFADEFLQIRPGTDAYLLAYIARELIEQGADRTEIERHVAHQDLARLQEELAPFDLTLVSERTGLAAEMIVALRDAIRQTGKIAITLGTGLNFTPGALVTQLLRWVILVITGSVDREGGMWVNAGWYDPLEKRSAWTAMTSTPNAPQSRPDLPKWLGEVPCGAMVDEIETGNLKALFINGGSPLTAFPQPDRMLAALRSLEVLVVLDVMSNELTQIATHVLPTAAMFERTDMVGGWSQHMGFAPQIVPMGGDRRKTWWIFAQLGRRLGFELIDGIDPDCASDQDVLKHFAAGGRRPAEDLIAAGPRGFVLPRSFGWVHDRVLPDGKWQIAHEALVDRLPDLLKPSEEQRGFRLVSGRDLHNHNRMAYGRYGYGHLKNEDDVATIGIHPDDAKMHQLRKDDMVTVRGDKGSVTAKLRLDDALSPGTLHLTHGWIGRNVCRLTSPEIDPQTGQPVMMSAIPVEIVAAHR